MRITDRLDIRIKVLGLFGRHTANPKTTVAAFTRAQTDRKATVRSSRSSSNLGNVVGFSCVQRVLTIS
ncbi:hypothetical protein CBS147346_3214 [Aspergillus niger]|nr:hypothetical protein CBS147346_3214 [Aspergillus niger]